MGDRKTQYGITAHRESDDVGGVELARIHDDTHVVNGFLVAVVTLGVRHR